MIGTGDPLVVGLDPSLTASGLAWPDGHTEKFGQAGLTTQSTPIARRGEMLTALVVSIFNITAGRGVPVLIVMEDLPPTPRHFDWERGYLWWSLVNVFTRRNVPVLAVPPTTLKKYATGKGNAAKTAMVDATARRLPQFETGGDDNRCDAAWLCALGRDMLGVSIVDMPAVNRSVLDKLQLPAGVRRVAS